MGCVLSALDFPAVHLCICLEEADVAFADLYRLSAEAALEATISGMPVNGEDEVEPRRTFRSRWADEEEEIEEPQAVPNGKVALASLFCNHQQIHRQ